MDAIPLLSRTTRLWHDKADFFRPFRRAARDSNGGENIRPLFDPELAHDHTEEDGDLSDLNNALRTLVDVFPDVEPEAFRDMLLNISQESRVEVVTEQVLRRGLRAPAQRKLQKRGAPGTEDRAGRVYGLTQEETFRGEQYQNAVRLLFYQEFKALSHSTIRGVMAENNGSYMRSRPVLQLLSSRTWRMSLVSLWNRKAAVEDLTTHPALAWPSGEVPRIRSTGSRQLDQELYDLLVAPVLTKQQHDRLISDQAMAFDVNEAEAIEHDATYDCECCYSTVAFEQITTCDLGDHFLCLDCVSRTTSEALYGQGWARSVDTEKVSVRCFAPVSTECQATIPAESVQRALQHDLARPDVWNEFNRRITAEVLLKSRAALQRCPNCTYAEVDETPAVCLKDLTQFHAHIRTKLRPHVPLQAAEILATTISPILLALLVLMGLLVSLLSFLLGIALLLRRSRVPPVTLGPIALHGGLATIAGRSLNRVYKCRRGLKFRCQDPTCMQTSCIRCLAVWRDPHVCFDTEKTSLRTAIEASATAAVKRTCPRCFLSFVKSSGCNKLVCNCGYTMCYVCREHITAREGYGHFCQHFRPMGGRCTECDRCDLYGDEDEDVAIRRAVELAEKEWRDKEAAKTAADSSSGAGNAMTMVDAVVGHGKRPPWVQRCVDEILDAVVMFQSG